MEPGSILLAASLSAKPWMQTWERPQAWRPPWNRNEAVQLGQVETLAVLEQPVFVPEMLLDPGKQPVEMRPLYRRLKALQRDGDNPMWFADPTALAHWLDGSVQMTLRAPEYDFPRIYLGLIDPLGRASLPEGVVEIYRDYIYRLWDVTGRMRRSS